MRKNIIMLLAAAIILCGCGSVEVVPAESPAPAAGSPALSYDGQAELIESCRDIWCFEDIYSDWSYTVTDLDRNGRYEVITASLQGSGLYTYASFYEVNETFDALVKCRYDIEEGSSQADMIVDTAQYFHDTSSDRYYYIFDDTIRNGAEGYSFNKRAISLYNGAIEEIVLAYKNEIFDASGSTSVTYTAPDGSPISESDYNNAAAKYFAGMESEVIELDWTQVAAEISREPSLVFAADLYDGYGFVHQLCDAAGVYDFSSINSDGVKWQVYILDDEFTEAERYIPQAYTCALEGGGSLYVGEGQWIYVYCPCNQWTGETAPDGCAFSWGLNPDGQALSPTPSAAPAPETPADKPAKNPIVITKNPRGECLEIGGHTWFIAHADNAEKLTWQLIDPNGKVYSLSEAMSALPGLKLEALEGDTIAVTDVPAEVNGWAVQAKFEGKGYSAVTDPAYLYVGDYLTAYASVFDNYRALINNPSANDPYGLGTDLELKNLGYKFKDLDKNGVPELLIAQIITNPTGSVWDKVIYSMFTLSDGQPVKVFSSWARSRYMYSSHGFYYEGSSGASFSDSYLCTFSGTALTVKEGVYTDGNYSNPYFHVVGGDRSSGKGENISEIQFNDYLTKFDNSLISLGQLTPIS